MFNAKAIFYPNRCEISVFDHAVFSHQRKQKRNSYVQSTPFGDMVPIYDFDTELYQNYREEVMRCSISRTKKNIRRIALSYPEWRYFVTFTFDKRKVKSRYDYDSLVEVLGSYLKHLKAQCPTIKYLIVPELHKDGAFHFHGLFSVGLPVKYAGYFKKSGGHVFHVADYGFGFTTATYIKDVDRTVSYILKYITKDLMAVSPSRRRYWYPYKQFPAIDELEFTLLPADVSQFFKSFSDYSTCMHYNLTVDNLDLSHYHIIIDSDRYSDIHDYLIYTLEMLGVET